VAFEFGDFAAKFQVLFRSVLPPIAATVIVDPFHIWATAG
jgi:hypothetical protein